jgi:hypothetical protein
MQISNQIYISVLAVILLCGCNKNVPETYTTIDQNVSITPDYREITLPPNIAPLNFRIDETAEAYLIKIYGESGKALTVLSSSAKIIIPEKKWRALLAANNGRTLTYEIYLNKNDWYRYNSFYNHIAKEKVDGYVVYRKIHPSHNSWSIMGLYQRNLQTFDEETILDNNNFQQGCCHCHAFLNNTPDKMLVGIRSPEYRSGLLFVDKGEVTEIGVKFGFTTWHPDGNLIVFSMNLPRLLLHTQRNEMRDIVDLDSWIGYFDLTLNKAKAIPQLARKDRLENYPVFSPDGAYLYYTEAPKLWEDTKKIDTGHFDQVKYSLMRIPYDTQNDRWGNPELILSSQETGLSINQPRVSPDGRWISFAMCAYGCWPSYHPNSDLYLLDLHSKVKNENYSYKRMEINSDECESWQNWSTNSRWLIFSSKRNNPLYNRTYLAYVDTAGHMSKSFILPQKDPGFYESYLMTYTIPELLSEPLTVKGEDLAAVIRSANKIKLDMPITGASPKQESREIYHQ